jgi:hypothetical protein
MVKDVEVKIDVDLYLGMLRLTEEGDFCFKLNDVGAVIVDAFNEAGIGEAGMVSSPEGLSLEIFGRWIELNCFCEDCIDEVLRLPEYVLRFYIDVICDALNESPKDFEAWYMYTGGCYHLYIEIMGDKETGIPEDQNTSKRENVDSSKPEDQETDIQEDQKTSKQVDESTSK